MRNIVFVALSLAFIAGPAAAVYPHKPIFGGVIPVSHGSLLVTTTGTGTWSVPAGVTTATMQCWGAGGGGGIVTIRGGGGGGGGFAATANISVTPGGTVYYSVGAGGPHQTSGNESWINATSGAPPFPSSSSTVGCRAGGGTGGTDNGSGGPGGAGLAYSGGAAYSGGSGYTAIGSAAGGGGGAGSSGAGGSGTSSAGGTAGTPDGGAGGFSNTTNPSQPGGGGGSNSTSAETGADGQIEITW